MRVHRLQVTAFGPFAGTETVDFDALSEAGLFLLHGATGAGKTTVLDAVCFALYGAVPGGRSGRQGRDLRSDHAVPELRPEVVLELTVSGRRLEITRSPAFDRPKRRGAGTTTEPARTSVRELVDGTWAVHTSRNDEAAHLVDSVVGMSLEQFTQVVMLPQGQFARFLRAEAEERRPLLEKLFATERFAAVEVWLAERRRSLAREVGAADAALAELVARAAEAAGADDDSPGDTEHDPDADPVGWLAELLSRAHDRAAATAAALTAAEGTRAGAAAAATAVRELAALHTRRAEARARLAVLTGDDESVTEAQNALAAARRALPVGEKSDLAARLRRDADDAGRAAVTAASAAGPAAAEAGRPAPADDATGAAAAWRDVAAALAIARGRTEGLVVLAQERDALLVDEQSVGARVETIAAAVGDLRGALAAAPAARARLEADSQAAALLAGGLPAATEAVARLRRRREAASELSRVREQLGTAEMERWAAVDAAQAATDRWLQLRQARLDGMAAELGALLAVGAACPVCGGTDHPAPASPGAAAITAADENAAQALVVDRTTRRESAERAVAELTATATALQSAVRDGADDEPTPEQLAELHSAARARATECREAADAMASLAAAVEAHDAATRMAADRLAALDTELAALVERRAGVLARVADLTGRLDDALVADISPVDRLTELARYESAAGTAARARERADDLAAAAALRAEEAALAAVEAGFDDLPGALGARRDDDWIASTEAALRARDEALAVARATLAEPAVQALGDDDPDVAAAEATAAAATAAASAAAVAAADAARSVAAFARLHTAAVDADAASAPLRAEHRRVADLSLLVEGTAGDNALRMRLSAYVLAARLEAVAAAASERLGRMTSGRFALEHTDGIERGGRRGGLGLRVLDAWTGAARETSSLSGGESFMASLALALGLSDVAQAEAGGAVVETLFVDEGFGSLDEDSLDEVMSVLDGLREGGRAVGVVSHVADLRQRIPAQLHVRKTRAGSTLEQV